MTIGACDPGGAFDIVYEDWARMPDIQDIYQAALIFSIPLVLAVMVLLVIMIVFLHCHRVMASQMEKY